MRVWVTSNSLAIAATCPNGNPAPDTTGINAELFTSYFWPYIFAPNGTVGLPVWVGSVTRISPVSSFCSPVFPSNTRS